MKPTLSYKDFVTGLKQNKLLGLRCRACGKVLVPPSGACLECRSFDLEVLQLTGRGRIETFTVVRVPPEPITEKRAICMVRIEEGGRLMGILIGVSLDDVTMDLIEKPVCVGCRVDPKDALSGGERVAVTFKLL